MERKLKAMGKLEKLAGKAKFSELVGPFIAKSDGREALVPEEDGRAEISPASEAADDFTAEGIE